MRRIGVRRTLQFADGQEFEGHQYQLPPEEEALLDAARARANANIGGFGPRLTTFGATRRLLRPESRTQDASAELSVLTCQCLLRGQPICSSRARLAAHRQKAHLTFMLRT